MSAIDNDGAGSLTDGEYPEVVLRVAHERLVPSATNPRKHFAPGPMGELAENILALARRAVANGGADLGVQQPLFVRALAGDDGRMEIIAGERRWRAVELAMEQVQSAEDAGAVIARLRVLPVLLKVWSDEEVVEFQLIENLRRDDLTPLEEADGYGRMISMGNTPETISQKVGTSLLNVLRALKWSRLPDLARSAFEAGLIGKEHSTLIARIPDERERRVAAVLVLEDNNYRDAADDDDKGLMKREALLKTALEEGTVEAMSIRDLREMVADAFMTTLADAAFNQADEDLLPVELDEAGERLRGGACLDCPYKTCNSQLYAQEVGRSDKGRGLGIDGNVCTQPKCKAEKTRLQWLRDVAAAEVQGVKVLDEKESKTLFGQGSSRLAYGAKYVALDEKPDISLTGHANSAKVKPWEKLLEDTGVVPVLARDGTGKTRRLVPKDVAVMAVNQKCAVEGKETPLTQAQELIADDDRHKEQQRKQVEEAKLAKRIFALTLAELLKAGAEQPAGLEVWRWMARTALHGFGMDGLRALADGLWVKPWEAKKGESLNQGHYAGALAETLAGEGATLTALQSVVMVTLAGAEAWRGVDSVRLKEACGLYDVSMTAMKAQARDEVKSKKKGKQAQDSRRKTQEDDVLTANRNAMEEIQKRSILGQGASDEDYAAEGVAFHCDRCGKVCLVDADQVAEVEAMAEGEFVCSECDRTSKFEPLPSEQQRDWEAVEAVQDKPEDEIKTKCQEWRAENPGRSAGAMADELGISVDDAFRIVDQLIDADYDSAQAQIAEIEARPDPKPKKGKKK